MVKLTLNNQIISHANLGHSNSKIFAKMLLQITTVIALHSSDSSQEKRKQSDSIIEKFTFCALKANSS